MTETKDEIVRQTDGRPHLRYLDGIRGLAALYVVLDHIWLFGSGGTLAARTGMAGAATNWLWYGHTAVDVFIVLSGFCLILPVGETGTIKGGARAFFLKRARRILPPYFAALLLCAALRLFAQHFAPQHLDHRLTAGAMLANGLLLEDVLPRFNLLNQPFWSVALEWKIYFAFPLIVVLLWRYGPVAALGAAAAAGYGLTWLLHLADPTMTLDHSCPWYLLLFATGCCAGMVAAKPREAVRRGPFLLLTGVLAAASIGLLWLFPVAPAGHPNTYVQGMPLTDPAIGGLAAMLLIWLGWEAKAGRNSPLLSFFSWRPLVKLGTFAYSIYLVHFPLVSMLHQMFHRLPGPVWIAFAFACIPLIVGAAYLFFLAFERPFLRVKKMAAPPLLERVEVLS